MSTLICFLAFFCFSYFLPLFLIFCLPLLTFPTSPSRHFTSLRQTSNFLIIYILLFASLRHISPFPPSPFLLFLLIHSSLSFSTLYFLLLLLLVFRFSSFLPLLNLFLFPFPIFFFFFSYHRTLLCGNYHSSFLFGRFRVRFSTQRPAVLKRFSLDFPSHSS